MARKDYDPASAPPDGRPPKRARLFDPEVEGPWDGSLEGLKLGSGVTVLAYGTDTVGEGPCLHVRWIQTDLEPPVGLYCQRPLAGRPAVPHRAQRPSPAVSGLVLKQLHQLPALAAGADLPGAGAA